MSNVRVRFAPSPTGDVHVGNARTALYNWLFARKTGGTFVLRIEDTDKARSTDESLSGLINELNWLGLDWDEGYLKGGKYGPYRQSERQHIYKEYADKLLSDNKAYYCFCTDEVLEEKKQKAMKEGRPPQYDGICRDIGLTESLKRIESGEKGAIRFKIGEKREYKFQDLVRKEVTFPSDMVGDFVIIRSNGMPVYNFCCTIDDVLMKITHVLRGEDHLSNTLRQLMIYESIDVQPPVFGHLSMILGPDRQKLSKRHGDTSCRQYREKGYLPEGLNNFMALLGWSAPDGKEIMTLSEMTERFAEDRFNPAAAVFDEQKLRWMNSVHLRNMDHSELWNRLQPLFKREGFVLSSDPMWIDKALETMKTSMEVLEDAVELFRPLSKSGFEITEQGRDTLTWDKSKEVIGEWKNLIETQNNDYMTSEEFDGLQNQVKETCGVKGKFLFMPIRVAVIGRPQGAELKNLVPLMNKELLMERAQACLV